MFNQTRDPVCGMKVREKNAAAVSEYEGEKYYFCSTSCKDRFTENPEKYTTGDEKPNKTMSKGHCCCH